ncbi:hypothetical protein HGM15179_011336 [Zosterops borbonicus]|uniref:Uncharacterized protein n=1 Tax=Zosterops borbonicus TaxID=364589 RepID=A0A8K1LJ13_9PASS|nr:hypothetical protein HGM15179_011336 [Zosterops borbonicus]
MNGPQGLEKSGQACSRCRAPQSKSTLLQQLDSLEEKELQKQEAEEHLACSSSRWLSGQFRQPSARDRVAGHATGQVTQESIQVDLECLQKRRLYDLMEQSLLELCHPQCKVLPQDLKNS